MADTLTHKPDIEFPFKYVDIYASADATPGIQVNWQLNPEYTMATTTPDFYVEFARSGGEWERLNIGAPIQDTVYVDTDKRRYNYRMELEFRVVADDGVEEHISLPSRLSGVWNTHDWLIARDIIRKEYLRLKQYVGTPMWLLRRRASGVRCDEPNCLDFDTNNPISVLCPTCHGTGYKNAFYNAIPFYVEFSPTNENKKSTGEYGTEQDGLQQVVRAVAYPRVDAYDMLVAAQTGERYVIRNVQDVAAVRNKPLVYNLQLFRVSGADYKHDVPLEQTVPDPAAVQGGWNEGFDFNQVEW